MSPTRSKIYVILSGRGGELDCREISSESEIASTIADMGPIAVGDVITVQGGDRELISGSSFPIWLRK